MKEKYNNWNILKQSLNNGKERAFFIKERQVWYIHNGINIGFESNGKGNDFLRPVLVLKKVGNLFFTVALTSKGKENNIFYYKFNNIQLQNEKYKNSSYVILSQVKVMDKKRFFEHIGSTSKSEFTEIKIRLKQFLF